MLKFAHFVIDDKFIPDSIKCFTDAGLTMNEYFYVRPKYHTTTDYLDKTIVNEISSNAVLNMLSQKSIDVVVLHSLYSLPFDLIAKIPKPIKVIWYAWGYDIYSNQRPLKPLFHINNRYGKETAAFLCHIRRRKRIKEYCRHILKRVFFHGYSKKIAEHAIYRIDYFAGVFQEEYHLLANHLPFFRAKQIVHNYIHPLEFAEKDIMSITCTRRNNLLLGNSATYNCNHLDLLSVLSNANLHNITIFCPLSYQGSQEYVKTVSQKGEQLFGKDFIPLTNYLPLSEYTSIINSCNCLVLGQMGQAATCNILTAIWAGLKVFLPKDSMNYQHYISEGLTVFTLEDINSEIYTQRTKEDIIQCRIIIEQRYSYRQWKADLKNSLAIICTV